MSSMIPFVAILASLFLGGEGIPIDNGLIGEAEISCLSDRVAISFTTEKSFIGHVFPKGLYLEESCNNVGDGNSAGISVEYEFESCGVTRQRSLEPKGVYVTGTVVIQFHPEVITKIDRAIRFQCFYMEADKTVDQDLEVSMITTEFQTFQVPMPICRYEILDAPNGSPVKFAIIGQKVYHTWVCDTDTVDIFCMEVYGCYVNNVPISSAEEDPNSIRLLDADGCALDGNLLQNPDYDDTDNDGARGLSAQKETHIFKYADRPDLFFNCQIRIGVRDPGVPCVDYRETTGGQCQDAPLTRRRRDAQRAVSQRSTEFKDFGFMDVAPQHAVYVADLDLAQEDIPAGLRTREERRPQVHSNRAPVSNDNRGFCISFSFFSVIIAFLTITIVTAVAMALLLCSRRSRKEEN